jgi:hypothetical protein
VNETGILLLDFLQKNDWREVFGHKILTSAFKFDLNPRKLLIQKDILIVVFVGLR